MSGQALLHVDCCAHSECLVNHFNAGKTGFVAEYICTEKQL